MPLGPGISGINANTPYHLILDAGIIYKNINVAPLRDGSPNPIPTVLSGPGFGVLGATRGGASFNDNREMRQVEVDGRRYPVKGLERVNTYSPELTCTLIEHTIDNLRTLMGPHTYHNWSLYQELEPDLTVLDSHYLTNIALFATVSGSTNPIIIVLDNPMMVQAMTLGTEDNNETAIECVWRAHADAANPYDPPYHVFVPPADLVPGPPVS